MPAKFTLFGELRRYRNWPLLLLPYQCCGFVAFHAATLPFGMLCHTFNVYIYNCDSHCSCYYSAACFCPGVLQLHSCRIFYVGETSERRGGAHTGFLGRTDIIFNWTELRCVASVCLEGFWSFRFLIVKQWAIRAANLLWFSRAFSPNPNPTNPALSICKYYCVEVFYAHLWIIIHSFIRPFAAEAHPVFYLCSCSSDQMRPTASGDVSKSK